MKSNEILGYKCKDTYRYHMFVVEAKTGQWAKVIVSPIKSSEFKKLQGFEFDWSKEKGYAIY